MAEQILMNSQNLQLFPVAPHQLLILDPLSFMPSLKLML
jgi:hypothetical protein